MIKSTDNVSNLEKGLYPHPQPRGYLTLTEYIFCNKDNKKLLLLRFVNESSVTVTSFALTVSLTGASGAEKRRIKVNVGSVHISPGKTFVMKKPIAVDNDCADFTVSVTSFTSSDYQYVLHKDSYNAYFALSTGGGRRREPSVRSVKRPGKRFASVIATLATVAVFAYAIYATISAETYAENHKLAAESENYSMYLGESNVEI